MEVYGIIYLIIDGTNDMEYVGQTTRPLKVRFKQHAKCKSNTYISNAIQAHGEENFIILVLKKCASKEELDFWEKHFIKSRDTKYPNGYNLTDGGDGVVGWTDEMRASVSAANTGKKRTPEQCAKISAARKGKRLSREHCAKLSEVRRGKKRRPETCANISKALTGKKKSPEHCANLSKAKKGKTPKDETRDRMSESRIGEKNHIYGTPRPKETRAKIAVKNRLSSPYSNLLAELDARQLTYAALAKILGLKAATISEKMRAGKNFTDNDKTKLAEFFDKPIEYLFQRDEEVCLNLSESHRKVSPYKNLQSELDARKLTYAKLAELMSSNKNSIARKMRGDRSFMDKEKSQIAEILGFTIEYLFKRDE